MFPTPEMIKAGINAQKAHKAGDAFEGEVRDILTAALALLPGKPVAWQMRQKDVGEGWLPWGLVREDTAIHYNSLNRTDIEVRPLYAAPAPQPVSVKALEKALERIGGTCVAGQDLETTRKRIKFLEQDIRDIVRSALSSPVEGGTEKEAYQSRVDAWMQTCFGEDGASPDWCTKCGGNQYDIMPGEEQRAMQAAISAYLSSIGGVVCAREPVGYGVWINGKLSGCAKSHRDSFPLHTPIPEAGNGDGWNDDMSKAPRDGTVIWLGHECGFMEPAYFKPAGAFWVNRYLGLPIDWTPRFWQRIPSPPTIRSNDTGRP